MRDCEEAVYSNDYADYMIETPGDFETLKQIYGDLCYEDLAGALRVIHIPRTANLPALWEAYRSFPKCYALLETGYALLKPEQKDGKHYDIAIAQTDSSHLEEIGVERLRRQPYLDLYGQGVIFGLIDTGECVTIMYQA